MVFIRYLICLGFQMKGWLVLGSFLRGVVPQIGFKNALNTMGLNLSLSEMLELYNRLDRNGTESARHQWDFMDLLNHFWDGGNIGKIWENTRFPNITPEFWAGFPRLAMNLGRFAGSLLFRFICTFVAASSGHGHQDSICMHLPFRSLTCRIPQLTVMQV